MKKNERTTNVEVAAIETDITGLDIDAINTALDDLDARLLAVEP